MLHKILLGFCMLMLSFVSNAQGIQFEKGTFKQALQKAKKENKLLFIDGYADWCAPCKKMEKTVFQEEEVGTYFDEHIVALKVDVEKVTGPKIKENMIFRACLVTSLLMEMMRWYIDFLEPCPLRSL